MKMHKVYFSQGSWLAANSCLEYQVWIIQIFISLSNGQVKAPKCMPSSMLYLPGGIIMLSTLSLYIYKDYWK